MSENSNDIEIYQLIEILKSENRELRRQLDDYKKQEQMLFLDEIDNADYNIYDLFDIKVLQTIQDAFSKAVGVGSLITLPDGTPVTVPSNFCRLCRDIIRKTGKGLANCIHSDCIIGAYNPNGPTIQPCLSGGLWDSGASIKAGDKHIGNWLIGQVRNDILDEQRMIDYALEIGADVDEFRQALEEVPVMPIEKFTEISRALFLIANLLSKTALQNLRQKRNLSRLSGLLPICASCKKIRDDSGYWRQIETYISSHTEAVFSHGLCPDCAEKLYGKEKWFKK